MVIATLVAGGSGCAQVPRNAADSAAPAVAPAGEVVRGDPERASEGPDVAPQAPDTPGRARMRAERKTERDQAARFRRMLAMEGRPESPAELAERVERERREDAEDDEADRFRIQREAFFTRIFGDRGTSCDLRDAPLADALGYFAERHGVRLVIDEAVPDETRRNTVSMRFRETTLAHALFVIEVLTGVRGEADGDGVRFVPLQ